MVPKTCAYRLPDGSQCTEDFFGFGGEAEYCWKHQAYQNMTDEEKEKRKQIDDSIHALRNPDADIRLRAIWGDGGWEAHFTGGLGMFNDDSSAIDALASALDDDNTEVRRAAVWALPSPDPRTEMHFVTALGDADKSVRINALHRLLFGVEPFGRCDTRVLEALISALDDESHDVRIEAISTLGNRNRKDSRVTQALINALSNDDSEVRWRAANAVASFYSGERVGVRKAVGPLIAALDDDNTEVRRAAVESLGAIGDLTFLEPLIAALDDEEPLVRQYATQSLGIIGDLRAVEPLIAALGDEEPLVRQYAIQSLGKIGDLGAVEPLIAALDDEEPLVRQYAIQSLGKIGDYRAVEPCIGMLDDDASEVRENAASALDNLSRRANDELKRGYKFPIEDSQTVVELLAAAVEPLIAVLGDEELAVRKCAAEALRVLGDRRTLDSLETTLATISEDAQKAEDNRYGGWPYDDGG